MAVTQHFRRCFWQKRGHASLCAEWPGQQAFRCSSIQVSVRRTRSLYQLYFPLFGSILGVYAAQVAAWAHISEQGKETQSPLSWKLQRVTLASLTVTGSPTIMS